jgi:two-component system sensor histidine kinase ChiS
VVLVTAKREPKDLQEGFAAGATDFLTKPYVRQELLARTKAHLGTARLSRAFHRHVPVEFAKLLGHEGAEGLRLGDCVERQLTVFFADIQGFTKASERMTSRQVFAWLNDCFSLIVPALRAHGGLVDKYIGDAVMAVFAASADHAVEAAIDATRALRQLDPKLRLGIGLHYGEAMIGTLGDADRFAPTVVSDTVNVASRLETMTRRFGARVLLTEETLQAMEAASRHSFRYIGTFRVKGRQKALRVHEALDAEPDGVAQSRGNATECLREVHEALARVDLETAWVAAKRGTEKFPDDGVLSFLAGEVEDLVSGGAGDAFDGVLELRTK